LGANAAWTVFTNFAMIGTNYQAVITPSNSTMFFRLVR
jgi:hypothetical protein